MEPLYTVSQGRQERRAVARDLLHALPRQDDLHVQAPAGRQVLQRPAHDLGRRQVLDRRGPGRRPGLGIHRRRDQEHRDAGSRDGRDHTPSTRGRRSWPTSRSSPTAIIPKDYGGETKKEFYTHPVGTGPFMWDHWDKGSELVLKKNPNYWQKGKPYLDSVTWRTVGDDNTRELQLEGGQAQIDEFPPFQTVDEAPEHAGREDDALPLDAHRLHDDERALRSRSPTCTSAGRSRYAIDRDAIVKSVLFGHGKPANSFMPPQVPYYDAELARASSTTWTRPSRRWPSRKYPNGFNVELLRRVRASADEQSYGQIIQQSLKQLGINVELHARSTRSIEFAERAGVQVPARLQLLDDGHRRPGRARHVRGRPELRREVVLHRLLRTPT